VNRPVDYHGLQITLNEFGFSPQVIIEKDGRSVFDYFLNLRNPMAGDYFPWQDEGLEIFALLFPDFVRDGDSLSSRSREANNPILLVKFIQDEKPLHKGLLLRPGEVQEFGEYTVRFSELRNWVNLTVVREWGVTVIAIGFLIGIPALFVRFLSNERRIEFALTKTASGGTEIAVRGYSRYYPAFLEREVNRMAEALSLGERA
jgi:cytochrome c biogenesis protein ResB